MRNNHRVVVIIPALNEAASLGRVLSAIPAWVDEVIVADNGSTDPTPEVGREHGARVVIEPRRGYGSACLRGIAAIESADVVAFLDADYSDFPEQMDRIVDPIAEDRADLVIGSRMLGRREPGALTVQARFGNALACFLIRLVWGVRFTDLGPFRAIRYSTLEELAMADPDYGWTVEMQIKAIVHAARITEAPVDYRRRIGRSKVSGTVRGVLGAGYKILGTIVTFAVRYPFKGQAASRIRSAIILFTRYPIPGRTKTRLIPALGQEGAADLQRRMTERMVQTIARVPEAGLRIHYAGGGLERFRAWLGDNHIYREQQGDDLGERMALAFDQAFDVGADRVVIIGVDCPEITPGLLRAAFEALHDSDLVLGPATDGGYYLLGIRKPARRRALPALFDGIEWGTDRVLEQTRVRVYAQGLRLVLSVPLDDLDRPEDLITWQRATMPAVERPALSIIIPTLNEARDVRTAVDRLIRHDRVEVIVADGGSTDGSPEIAEAAGARVVHTGDGRGRQMNYGSAKASADTLMFLHADTILPDGFLEMVESVLSMPGTAAGAFQFRTDDTSLAMRIIEFTANRRSRWLQRPYGDQAIFVRKSTFRELGGFPEIPIMEDYVFVRSVRRRGRVRLAPAAAITSARRWRNMGKWRTTLYNQLVLLGYHAGWSPERLAAFYNRRRGVSAMESVEPEQS